MPAWVIPLIAAAASVTGSVLANRANRQLARDQMDFQREMSDTSVRRSVEDYRAAGLNPALAYDRTASSPTGASTTLGDPIGAGVSSAMRARELAQQLQLARETAYHQNRKTEAETQLTRTTTANQLIAGDILRTDLLEKNRSLAFNLAAQPAQLRLANAQAMLQELLVPGARNTAAFEGQLSKLGTGAGSQALRALLETIKTLRR